MDTQRDDEAFDPESALSPADGRARAVDTWLLVAGILMVLTGVALVLLPTVLPQHGWIARSLASRGVTSLPIAITGVLMCGLAMTSRMSRAHFLAAMETTRESSPAIEELAEQVAHLGDGLQGVRIEFVYLKDALQAQLDQVQNSAPADNAGDAVYRLAASLDQVGMRIEERLNASHHELGESLHAVALAIESIRESTVAASTAERGPAGEPYGTRVDAASRWNGEDASRPARLGLLDMLDDLGRLLPRKTSADSESIELEGATFEDAQDEGWKRAVSIPAPLPDARADNPHLTSPADLLGSGFPRAGGISSELQLGDKLEELRGLLADERVREALASLERSQR